MKKSFSSKKFETLSKKEMHDIEGGGVLGTNFNTYCEWYAHLTGIPMEDVPTHSVLGAWAYQLDVALGLM